MGETLYTKLFICNKLLNLIVILRTALPTGGHKNSDSVRKSAIYFNFLICSSQNSALLVMEQHFALANFSKISFSDSTRSPFLSGVFVNIIADHVLTYIDQKMSFCRVPRVRICSFPEAFLHKNSVHLWT